MKTLCSFTTFTIILFLVSCSWHKDFSEKKESMSKSQQKTLFEDPMTGNWQDNWFLDGKKATVENRDSGLYFSGGTITKKQDKEKYHAHHAVLWTKQVFEGDLAISFEITRVDNSDYGNILVYIQAEGIGIPPYEKDIHAWKKLREIPAMSTYFNYMNLLSVSLRENVRCKRYPFSDMTNNGAKFKGPLIGPMLEYGGLKTGKTYKVEIEKKNPLLNFKISDAETGQLIAEHTWDVSENTDDRKPHLITKGRIGIRHMSTKQMIYKNFQVKRIGKEKTDAVLK